MTETAMSWLFVKNQAGWPVHLLYVLEAVFIALPVFLVLLARPVRRWPPLLGVLSIVAGISLGLAIVWPIALAPFFFSVSGEAMLATLPLALLAAPFVIGLSIFGFFRSSAFQK